MKKEKLESGKPLKRKHYEDALAQALKAGYDAWRKKKETAHVDAVEAAIRVMEDSELFNAGHGAALNHDGRAELDAAIMEGKMGDWKKGDPEAGGKKDPRKRAGAVAAVWHIKNPISAARAVMEMPGQRHVLLVGEGAEAFVFSEQTMKRYPGKLERVSNAYFWTERRLRDIRREIQGDEKRGARGAAVSRGRGGGGTDTSGPSVQSPGRGTSWRPAPRPAD
jgi:beta-aspartyl-peptidase (threonine type)